MNSTEGSTSSISPHFFLTTPGECLSVELRQEIFSLRAGLRPVRGRIEGLYVLQQHVNELLMISLNSHVGDLTASSQSTIDLSDSLQSMELCLVNSRDRVQAVKNDFLNLVFTLLRSSRRASRMRIALSITDTLSRLMALLTRVDVKEFVETVSLVKAKMATLPAGLKLSSEIHSRLSLSAKTFREKFITHVVSVCVSDADSDRIHTELSCEFGMDDKSSVLFNVNIFWYMSSSLDEEQLVAHFAYSLLDSSNLSTLFAPTNWSVDVCISNMEKLIENLILVSSIVPVFDTDLVRRISIQTTQLLLLYVFLLLSGSDLSLAASDIEQETLSPLDKYELHAKLRRQKIQLSGTCDLVRSEVGRASILPLLRVLPRRTGFSVTGVVTTIESCYRLVRDVRRQFGSTDSDAEMEGMELVMAELAVSAYTTLVESSLEHTLNVWHDSLVSNGIENYEQPNSLLLNEIRGFLNIFSHLHDESFLHHMHAVIQSVVVERAFLLVPEIVGLTQDGEDGVAEVTANDFNEMVSDLRLKLRKVLFATNNADEWSLLFECAQMMTHRVPEEVTAWAESNVDRIPLQTLEAVVSTAAFDTEATIDNFIFSSLE